MKTNRRFVDDQPQKLIEGARPSLKTQLRHSKSSNNSKQATTIEEKAQSSKLEIRRSKSFDEETKTRKPFLSQLDKNLRIKAKTPEQIAAQ